MNTAQALSIINAELIESPTRCHYPYVLHSGPTSIPTENGTEAGVWASIDSDAFGRIASANGRSISEVFRQLAIDLKSTREERWERERGKD